MHLKELPLAMATRGRIHARYVLVVMTARTSLRIFRGLPFIPGRIALLLKRARRGKPAALLTESSTPTGGPSAENTL